MEPVSEKVYIFILRDGDLFSQDMFYFERFRFILKDRVFSILKGGDVLVPRIILAIEVLFFPG